MIKKNKAGRVQKLQPKKKGSEEKGMDVRKQIKAVSLRLATVQMGTLVLPEVDEL